MRILFALPGLHRVHRGAEVAFESVAHHIGLAGSDDVLLLGCGGPRADRSYRFHHVPCLRRELFERLPTFPLFRSEYMYEEFTFAASLLMNRPADVDITVTCSYPYTNWALRARLPGRKRPAHVFVTQNGDWPAWSDRNEFRFFSCEGLICTNPFYFERNKIRWFSSLIPNGVDPERFKPGPRNRAAFGLPEDRRVALIVSALVPSKRVLEAMEAVSHIPDLFLVVAGDGPLRDDVDRCAAAALPGRFIRCVVPHERMPDLYRCADAFLHPAIHESFGNVYVEALATGLPVIANDAPLTRWILGEHGYLVDIRSSDSMVAGLSRALDQAQSGILSRASFAAENFAWKSVAARYRRFFEEVLTRDRQADGGTSPRV